MVESPRVIVSDEEALSKILGEGVTGETIEDKLVMPRPGDKGIVVRFHYVKDKDGTLGIIKIVKNEKFTTGEGKFFNVELVDNPGVMYQMGAGKSAGISVKRMCNTNGWKLTDLPGKIAHITANYYPKVKCSKCNGRGCVACENTGNSTVFNIRARLDLMSAVPKDARKDEF